MSKHYAKSIWEGDLQNGNGNMIAAKENELKVPYSFSSRFEDGEGKSPEELIGAAHSGCFSMALSMLLGEEGYKPEKIETDAEVTLAKSGDGFMISEILLKTKGRVQGIEEDKFTELAETAKKNCPVSQALKGVNIKLESQLAN
jgi:osmotically inducible protein OsmC